MKRSVLWAWASIWLAALAAHAPGALAQGYPGKPVSLIVAYPPGGAIDIILRLLQPKLTADLGQPVLIVNRPGAGGNIANESVAKAPNDGYTLLVTGDGLVAGPHLYGKSLRFDLFKDLTPVIRLVELPFALLVHPGLEVNTLAEFISLARRKPGTINYATPGNGTSNHLSAEWLKSMAGIELVHVPYKGAAAAMSDLVAGRVNAILISTQLSAPPVQSGKLKALGVASTLRSGLMPQVPTFAEAGLPGFVTGTFFGVLAPAGTSQEIVQRLSSVFAGALRAPDAAAKLGEMGAYVAITTPGEFAQVLQNQYERWGKVVRDNNIRLE